MRFLVDACASSRVLLTALKELGCDVLSIRDRMPGVPDEAVLALAIEEDRVLITADKDFGELVFLRNLPHPCIVRLVDMNSAERADVMRFLLEHHDDAMRNGAIIVVTSERIRIRKKETVGRHDEF